MTLSRRHLLGATAALPFTAGCAHAAGMVTLSVDQNRGNGMIVPDYMGLGYEISSVAVPGLLSAKNTSYVQLVRNLGRNKYMDRRGVIRIGGNTSDFATYAANGTPISSPKATVVTEANLVELRGFLDELRWGLIWGLNLGSDRLDNAVEEAQAVFRILGNRLIAFEVGNEPDLFSRAGHRPADYGYDAWLKDYRRYKAAIRTVVPNARFAGPDLAGAADWMTRFAQDEGKDIRLLTAHHYITGQANPAATQEFMLAEEKKFQGALASFRDASMRIRKDWRMCETASFSGGGKDGVSNTFAAALWVLDYLFVLASYGCAGVNMQTGVNHLGKISYYTPIGDDLQGHYSAAPEYYGLLAFAQAGKGETVAARCEAGDVNLTAYAVRQGNGACLVLINKDQSRDAIVAIRGIAANQGRLMRLAAPSLSAMSGISLGGASVDGQGNWRGKSESVRLAGGLRVPAGSAALVWVST